MASTSVLYGLVFSVLSVLSLVARSVSTSLYGYVARLWLGTGLCDSIRSSSRILVLSAGMFLANSSKGFLSFGVGEE